MIPAAGARPYPGPPHRVRQAEAGARSATEDVDTAIDVGRPGRAGAGQRPALQPAARPGRGAAAAACSPSRRSPTTSQIVVRYVPAAEAAPRSAATGTTPSCSPAAPTMLVDRRRRRPRHRAPRPPWGRCAGLLRGIAVLQRRRPGRGAHRAGPGHRGPAAGHDGHRRGRPPGADRRRAAAPGVTRLRWSNAGHPPPMVIDPGRHGRRSLRRRAADLLLGVDPETERREHVVALDRGRDRAALHRRPGRAARPRPRRGRRRLLRACSASSRRPAARRALRRGARAAVPARRARTTSRSSPSGCTARTGPVPPRPGPTSCPTPSRTRPPWIRTQGSASSTVRAQASPITRPSIWCFCTIGTSSSTTRQCRCRAPTRAATPRSPA